MSAPVARTSHTAALALEYADRLVLSTVRDMHGAIAARAFAYLPLGRIPAAHGAASGRIYAAISLGFRGSSSLARAAASHGVGRPIEEGVRGRQVVAVVNSMIGPELAEHGDPHAISMSLRRDAADVPCEPGALSTAYPDARSGLVLLVHGLGENDDSWGVRAECDGASYDLRIEADTGATPVLVRYNSGLHVSDNGAELDLLVEDLIESWPVPVARVHLIGHSMGGLVVRAATNQAVARGAAWPGLVANVVCLGTPHLGASLEKAVHLGARALRVVPETVPLARILDVRSPGIVDLRHGYISRDEWYGQDLTSRWGLDRVAAAPLAHADYHFVAATLGRSRGHLASQVLGDWFVRFPSAAGRGRSGAPIVAHAEVDHVPNAHHFALLRHPLVADWLVQWINGRPGALTR